MSKNRISKHDNFKNYTNINTVTSEIGINNIDIARIQDTHNGRVGSINIGGMSSSSEEMALLNTRITVGLIKL